MAERKACFTIRPACYTTLLIMRCSPPVSSWFRVSSCLVTLSHVFLYISPNEALIYFPFLYYFEFLTYFCSVLWPVRWCPCRVKSSFMPNSITFCYPSCVDTISISTPLVSIPFHLHTLPVLSQCLFQYFLSLIFLRRLSFHFQFHSASYT